MTGAALSARDVEFRAADNCRLQGTIYPVAEPRALVLMVHGLGEHSGRYAELGAALATRGFLTVGYDHRGHGRSEGARGDAPSLGVLVDDLERVRASLNSQDGAATRADGRAVPQFIFGHSMGGLITLRHLGRGTQTLAGAVLSAPWLQTLRGPGPVLRALARVIERIAPRVRLNTRLRPDVLTRDSSRVAAYLADPLNHRKISARLFFSIERAQQEVLSRPGGFGIPVLFLVPDADGLVDPLPTIGFAKRLDRASVELEILKGVRHEPLQDLGRERVVQRIGDWFERIVNERAGARS